METQPESSRCSSSKGGQLAVLDVLYNIFRIEEVSLKIVAPFGDMFDSRW